MSPDQLAGAQWVTQVTEVELSTTTEGGEEQIHGATVTAVHKFEYNGINWSKEPEVKKKIASTRFFMPGTHTLPQVGDVLAFEFVTVSQGLDRALPALPLINAQTALNGGDSTDSPQDGDTTQGDDIDADA